MQRRTCGFFLVSQSSFCLMLILWPSDSKSDAFREWTKLKWIWKAQWVKIRASHPPFAVHVKWKPVHWCWTAKLLLCCELRWHSRCVRWGEVRDVMCVPLSSQQLLTVGTWWLQGCWPAAGLWRRPLWGCFTETTSLWKSLTCTVDLLVDFLVFFTLPEHIKMSTVDAPKVV